MSGILEDWIFGVIKSSKSGCNQQNYTYKIGEQQEA